MNAQTKPSKPRPAGSKTPGFKSRLSGGKNAGGKVAPEAEEEEAIGEEKPPTIITVLYGQNQRAIINTSCKSRALLEHIRRKTRSPRSENHPLYPPEQRVIDHLDSRCKRDGRPVLNPSEAVDVSLTFYLHQVLDMDERTQTMTTTGVLQAIWRDACRVWNVSEYGGVESVSIRSDTVWLPDISVENSADGSTDLGIEETYRIFNRHNGEMEWPLVRKFRTTCLMHLRWFPFDKQRCNITFWTYMHMASQVMLRSSSNNMSDSLYSGNHEWRLLGHSVTDEVKFVTAGPYLISVPRFIVSLTLKRLFTFYGVNIIAPCILITCLLSASFYLPPESGEKIALGTASLVSFSVFLLMIAGNFPKNDDVFLLAAYLLFFMVMTTLSIVLNVVVLNYHHRPNTVSVSRGTVTVLQRIAQIVCHTLRYREQQRGGATSNTVPDHMKTAQADTILLENGNLKNHKTYLAGKDRLVNHCRMRQSFQSLQEASLEDEEGESRPGDHADHSDPHHQSQHIKWRAIACLLDRIFLVSSIFINIVASLVFFVVIPEFTSRYESHDDHQQ